jgi:hypothetical protein
MADALKPATRTDGGFRRTLRLRDGLILGVTVAAVAMASIGGSVGALGAWAAVALWAVACSVAFVQNHLFAEMASMSRRRGPPGRPRGPYAQRGLLPVTPVLGVQAAGPIDRFISSPGAVGRQTLGPTLNSLPQPGQMTGRREGDV